MSTRLFVGGLAWATTNDSLRSAFEKYGAISDVNVIKDRETGRSRGFGFVTYEEEQDADEALKEMNNTELEGRTIRVDKAGERPAGGGGGRGGYGGRRDDGGYGGRGGGRSYGGDRRGGDYGGERRERRDYNDSGSGYERRDNRGGRRDASPDRY